jgi:hypothetical protein
MTEAEARDLLRAFNTSDKLEAWIADQPWRMTPDGWTVATELDGWRFRLMQVPGGLRVSASAPGGGRPAVWSVSGAAVWTRTGANDDE